MSGWERWYKPIIDIRSEFGFREESRLHVTYQDRNIRANIATDFIDHPTVACKVWPRQYGFGIDTSSSLFPTLMYNNKNIKLSVEPAGFCLRFSDTDGNNKLYLRPTSIYLKGINTIDNVSSSYEIFPDEQVYMSIWTSRVLAQGYFSRNNSRTRIRTRAIVTVTSRFPYGSLTGGLVLSEGAPIWGARLGSRSFSIGAGLWHTLTTMEPSADLCVNLGPFKGTVAVDTNDEYAGRVKLRITNGFTVRARWHGKSINVSPTVALKGGFIVTPSITFHAHKPDQRLCIGLNVERVMVDNEKESGV